MFGGILALMMFGKAYFHQTPILHFFRRENENKLSNRSLRWLLVPAALVLLGGCQETAVTIEINPGLKIPDRLDACCMTLVADRRYQFSYHQLLSEEQTQGEPWTFSVVADGQEDFWMFLRGDLLGRPIVWQRHQFTFFSGEIYNYKEAIPFPSWPANDEEWNLVRQEVPLLAKPATVAALPALGPKAQGLIFEGTTVKYAPIFVDATTPTLVFDGAPGPAIAVEAADLNNDCLQDVVVLYSNAVHLFIQEQDGGFSPHKVLDGAGLIGMSLGRFNADTFLDLVLVTNTQITLFVGSQEVTFTADSEITLPSGLEGITGVDHGLINNDLHLDIVLSRSGHPNVVLYREGNVFTRWDEGLGEDSTGVLVAELYRSAVVGNPDDVHKEFHEVVFSNADDSLTYYHNERGKPREVVPNAFKDAVDVRAMLAHDMDRDGTTDLIVVEPTRTRIFYNEGSDTFNVKTLVEDPEFAVSQIQISDIDGDFVKDLVLAGDSGVHWWRSE